MLKLFNNNLAFQIKKEDDAKTHILFQIFLLIKYQIFFEFDPDFKTFKFIPKIQTHNNYEKGQHDGKKFFRLMIWWFSFGMINHEPKKKKGVSSYV